MSMKVNVHLEVTKFVLLDDCCFGSVDRWLELLAWVKVEPIQIMIMCIESIIASRNSVGVEQWNNLELIIISDNPSLFSAFGKDEVENSVEDM